jgi:hypothetical protein
MLKIHPHSHTDLNLNRRSKRVPVFLQGMLTSRQIFDLWQSLRNLVSQSCSVTYAQTVIDYALLRCQLCKEG